MIEFDSDESDLKTSFFISSLLKLKKYPRSRFNELTPQSLKTLADECIMDSLKNAIIIALGLISGAEKNSAIGNESDKKSSYERGRVYLKRFKILILVESSLMEEISGILEKEVFYIKFKKIFPFLHLLMFSIFHVASIF